MCILDMFQQSGTKCVMEVFTVVSSLKYSTRVNVFYFKRDVFDDNKLKVKNKTQASVFVLRGSLFD